MHTTPLCERRWVLACRCLPLCAWGDILFNETGGNSLYGDGRISKVTGSGADTVDGVVVTHRSGLVVDTGDGNDRILISSD